MKTLLTIWFIFFACIVEAQDNLRRLRVSACLSTTTGQAVADAQISIRQGYSGPLLAFFSTDRAGCFVYDIGFKPNDSLLLIVSHPAFHTRYQHLQPASDSSLQIGTLYLLNQNHVLPAVTIQTPPMWVRGDTTFFSADYYKEGNEKKLKDLLVKMPGFEIDETGSLLYKKRKVEKFLIEGEPLFAEKTGLLMNSIPVHVIQTLQVLDNQNHNRLLRGLQGDNSIFLNVGLKKEKRHAAFGDAEAGIGSNGMYTISPSWFLLGKNVKWGYAGNNNSTGTGFDWNEEKDIRPQSLAGSSRGMMNEQFLHLVNNFPGRRYVRNRRFSNHMQANYSLAPNLKATSQLEQLNDRQRQASYFESNVLNDTNYFLRTEKRNNQQIPSHWRFTQTVEWQLSDRQLLRHSFTGYLYRQAARQRINLSDALGSYATSNLLNSGITFWEMNAEYTHRVSPAKAHRLFFQGGTGRIRQRSSSISSSWYSVFDLPDVSYNSLRQQNRQRALALSGGWEILRKKKSPSWQHGIYTSFEQQRLRNQVSFRENEPDYSSISWPWLNAVGRYTAIQLSGKSSINLNWQKRSVLLSGEYGWAYNELKEIKRRQYHYPIGDINVTMRSPLSARWSYTMRAGYSQRPFEWYHLTALIYPQSPSAFYTSRVPGVANKNLALTGTLHRTLGRITYKGSSSLMLFASFNRQSQSLLHTARLSQVYQLSVDTLISRPTRNVSASISHFFARNKNNLNIQTSVGYNHMTRFIMLAEEIKSYDLVWWNALIVVKQNWPSKYAVNLVAQHNLFCTQMSGVAKMNLNGKSSTTRVILKQDLLVITNHRFTFTTEWYSSSQAGSGHANTVFADLEWYVNIPNSSWSISLLLNNISNRKNYFTLRNTVARQDFFQVPLVKRNLFFTIRYQL